MRLSVLVCPLLTQLSYGTITYKIPMEYMILSMLLATLRVESLSYNLYDSDIFLCYAKEIGKIITLYLFI